MSEDERGPKTKDGEYILRTPDERLDIQDIVDLEGAVANIQNPPKNWDADMLNHAKKKQGAFWVPRLLREVIALHRELDTALACLLEERNGR